jgi:SPP1 family predicted phage head-tail adaptor
MRERVIPQAKSVTRNSIGEEVVTWSDLVTSTSDHAVWAEVTPLRGREFFAANSEQYACDVRIRIRYLSGVQRENRMMWRGEPYDITQIIDQDARKETMEILAVAGVRNGIAP